MIDGYVMEWLIVLGKVFDYGVDGSSGYDNKGLKGVCDLVKEVLYVVVEKGLDLF